MYRYDSTFGFKVQQSDGSTDVRVFDVELLIRNASDGKKYLYDIVNIKENTATKLDLQQGETRLAAHEAATWQGVSKNTLSQTGAEVNEEYSLKGGGAYQRKLLALSQKEAVPETGIKVGRVTTIRRPYQGPKPIQAQKNAVTIQVDSGSVRRAQNRIEGARALDGTPVGEHGGFKATLKKRLQESFRPTKGVEVEGVTFDGKPYLVDINKKVLGKVVNDKNLTAEKIALLDVLPDVVSGGEYVGSGEYVAHGTRQKKTVRYDYFETAIEISEKAYIASFDVEVEPNVNNYRTHKLIKIDLKEIPSLDAGPAPTAAEFTPSGPIEGTRPPQF